MIDDLIANKKTPIEFLNHFEKENKQIAKRSLKEGLADQLTMVNEYPAEVRLNIDKELEENKLPGLITLQSVFKDTLGKVLKRERIKNLEEYYSVKELVVNQDNGISEQERIKLDKFMGDFEQKQNKSK
jgi:hypothetical protein